MAGNADIFKALRKYFLAKNVPSDALDEIEDVMDIFNEPGGEHKAPSREEIKTGPSESASGDGAFKMVGEYSKPAPQTLIVESYEDVSKMLEGMMAAQKANTKQIAALAELLLTKSASTEKAAPAEETFIGKAEMRLATATKALRKADMADEDEKEEREDCLGNAERALSAAKKLLAKAEKENEEDMDEDKEEKVEKALSTYKRLFKALTVAKAESEKEKEEDKEVEKAEGKTAHEKEGEAEREALKQHEKEKVEKADTNRIEILERSVQEVLQTVAGISKGSAVVPDFVKSMQTESISDRVESAMEEGTLSMPEMMKAKDILARVEAAKLGQYDGSQLKKEIADAPERVRDLFKAA